MESALVARIIAAAALSALGTRVHWEEAPQGAVLPYCLLHLIDEQVGQSFDGFDGLTLAVVQADVRAATQGEASALARALRDALAPPAIEGGVRFSRAFFPRARGETERTGAGAVYRRSLDIEIRWR